MPRWSPLLLLCGPSDWRRFGADELSVLFTQRIRPLGAILNAGTPANSEACSEIPYPAEQRIFAKEQRICMRETGNRKKL
jgi:hypothetical protein